MDDEPLTQPEKELSSELTGLNKGQKELKKKQLIIGIVAGVSLAILIIIIIVVSATGSNNKSSPNLKGEINLTYDVSNTLEPIPILGIDFRKEPSEFDIYVNNTKIKYVKEYKFDSIGINTVQIKLYSDLNMDYMFRGVEDLIDVEMHSNGKCKITSMISTFEDCKNLKNFIIFNFNTEKLTSTHKLFYNSKLEQYNFSNFDTYNLLDISYMFAHTELVNFTFGDFNTQSVTNMSHLLEDCYSLINIDATGANTSNVIDMSYMFKSVGSVAYMVLTYFDTKNVKYMNNMFQDCITLSLLGQNFDTRNVVDLSYFLDSCFTLSLVDVSNFDTSNVKNMSNMFRYCANLGYVYLGI